MAPSQKEQFFHELTQLMRSGVPLPGALEVIGRNPRSRLSSYARRVLERMPAAANAGEAFLHAGFNESDAGAVESGETTGHFAEVFSELEEYYHEIAVARRAIIAKSIYPIFILHFGAIVLAIPLAILNGGWAAFFSNALPILIAFYAGAVAVFMLWRFLCGMLKTSPSAARGIMAIPVVGGFLADWSSWKFSAVLALHVGAGGSILRALQTAGRASGNALFAHAGKAVVSQVQSGERLADAMRHQRGFPEILERAIEVGEHSGRLEDETRRAAQIFKDRTLGRLNAFATWVPRALYLAIVLYMGWRIIDTVTTINSNIQTTIEEASQ